MPVSMVRSVLSARFIQVKQRSTPDKIKNVYCTIASSGCARPITITHIIRCNLATKLNNARTLETMASSLNTITLISEGLRLPTELQIDEDRQILYVLTNFQLIRIDLNDGKYPPQIVCQHNRKFLKADIRHDDNDDTYSQGDSEDEDSRLSDPFEDSEPSTGDEEEAVENRRNWRRYGWRNYRLDNPCSILFLASENRLIVLNEGVISLMTVVMENGRPFAQGSSNNIFCLDFDVFAPERSVQPWSIAPTNTEGVFVFSLLDGSHLYCLNISDETHPAITSMITIPIVTCANLLFHRQSNKIFIYDANQVLMWSISSEEVLANVEVPMLTKPGAIRSMAIDQNGFIYIWMESKIFKYQWNSRLELVEQIDVNVLPSGYVRMAVSRMGTEFYLCDVESGSIYRCSRLTATM